MDSLFETTTSWDPLLLDMHAISIYWMSFWFLKKKKKNSYFLVSSPDSCDYCICPQQSRKEDCLEGGGCEVLLDPWQFRVSGEEACSLKSSGERNFCVEVRNEA